MALNKSTCAQEIVDKLNAGGKLVGMGASDKAAMKADIELFVEALFDHIKNNAVVSTTLSTSLNSVFSTGAPVPTDGGAALQTAWKGATAGGVADGSTGTIS